MNTIQLGETVYQDFTVSNPVTGAAVDADVLPTAEVFEDDSDVVIQTPTIRKRVGKTGVYVVKLEVTAANGFEIDKTYNVIVSATVGGVVGKASIATFLTFSDEPSDWLTVTPGPFV